MVNKKYDNKKSSKSFSIQDEDSLQFFPLIAKPSTTLRLTNSLKKKNLFFFNNIQLYNQSKSAQNIISEMLSASPPPSSIKNGQFPVPPVRRRIPTIPLIDEPFKNNNNNNNNNYKSNIDDDLTINNLFAENFQKLSFANFDKKYSMGAVNGKRQEVAPENLSYQNNSRKSDLLKNIQPGCCFGRYYNIEIAAVLIAFFELCFILYQASTASITYNKTGDENAFAFSLMLFSFVLAIIAVILLFIGIQKRSSYFLVPYLLMQLAILVSTFALCVYLILLLIGGTSITIDTIFFENSSRGELGFTKSTRIPTVKKKILVQSFNMILIVLLILTSIFFIAQICFFIIVQKCYTLFNQISIVKKTQKKNGITTMPTPTSNQTTAVDILQQNNNLNVSQNFQLQEHLKQQMPQQQQQQQQCLDDSQQLNNSQSLKSFTSSYTHSNRQRIKPELNNSMS